MENPKFNEAYEKQFKVAMEEMQGANIDVLKKHISQNKALFSGLIWTGEQALALGLVDGLGSSSYVAREIIKVKKLRDFTLKPDYLERLAQRFGQTMANILSQEIKGTISLQ